MKRYKQVENSHYGFGRYMHMRRWSSMWYQIYEITKIKPHNVLEIGAGLGLLKANASIFGAKITTVDIDPDLGPDIIASAEALPFSDNSYEVVCAFQVLEHFPYHISLKILSEIVRISRDYVIISLPDTKTMWRYFIHIPILGPRNFFIPKPRLRKRTHVFDGEHYWELNKRGYLLPNVMRDFKAIAHLVKTYRINENSYHRFFIFKKPKR